MAKTLNINVVNKVATYCQRGGDIVCGNSDYVIAFTFDTEWDAHPIKTARFVANGKIVADVVFEGTSVAVPVIHNALSVAVGVFSGNLKTTTPAIIGCQKSILCEGGSPADPAPDVYNQIIDLLNNGGGGGGGSGGSVSIVQEMGDSETSVMSQKAVTETYEALSDRIRIAEEKIDDIETGEGGVGVTPIFEVDEVVTLEAGENAYVDIDNADPAKPRISFGIPKGADGKDGSSADISELEADVDTLKQQMANLLYTAISVTSFSHNAGTKEYGQTVSSVTLSWAINKTPTALTLDGEALDVSARSKALTGLSITKDNNKTWKLVATDEREATSTKTTTISFCNGVYYGVGAAQDAYDSAFVLGLTKNLRSNKLTSVTVTAGAGEYIFYCLPKRMGTCTFKVGGFEGGFELVATMSFTNASGYTEDYYIYKSVNANLGKTTVSIS